jgi:aryl-alcohol dehydrogenase-like predicted oxidoreductase
MVAFLLLLITLAPMSIPLESLLLPGAVPLGFGTYHLLDRVSPQDAEQSILRAYKAGVRIVDTSDNYLNEEFVGRIVDTHQLDLFIATKTGLATTYEEFKDMQARGRSVDLSPERIAKQLTASRKALGKTTVDLYQVHAFDEQTPASTLGESMTRFIEAGYITQWGVSNYSLAQLDELVMTCDALRLARPQTVQPAWNLFGTTESDAIARAAHDEGMTVLAHSPLMKGLLADDIVDAIGEMLDETLDEGISSQARPYVEAAHEAMARARSYAHNQGYTLSEFALAWLTQHPDTVVLNACVDQRHLESTIKALNWAIPLEGMALAEQIRKERTIHTGAPALMEAVARSKPYYAKRSS